jgi:hypothetical protein
MINKDTDMKHILSVITAFVVIHLLLVQKAYAYLDPGTSSYILQVIVAILIGSALATRVFWNKIMSFFKQLFSKRNHT